MAQVHDREKELYREVGQTVESGLAGVEVLADLRDGRLDGRITDRDMEIDQVRHLLAKGG